MFIFVLNLFFFFFFFFFFQNNMFYGRMNDTGNFGIDREIKRS